MGSLRRILCTAWSELAESLRNRRAMLVLMVFLTASGLAMYASTGLVSSLEREVVGVLQLPPGEGAGSVTTSLWKSKPFRRMVKGTVKDPLVYAAVQNRHPFELLYAFFVFAYVPILAVLTSGSRVCDEVASGAVCFQLLRVRRHEWVLGKWLGQCLLQLPGLALGGLVAYGILVWRMPEAGTASLLPALQLWSFKAWFLLSAWVGLAMSISLVTRSQAKANSWAFFLVMLFSILPRRMLSWPECADFRGWASHFIELFPVGIVGQLWEGDFACWFTGGMRLLALSLFYLSFGYAVFAWRDAR